MKAEEKIIVLFVMEELCKEGLMSDGVKEQALKYLMEINDQEHDSREAA